MRKVESLNEGDLLLAIQELLDGVEWTASTLNEIAALMIASGYRIRDRRDVDLTDGIQIVSLDDPAALHRTIAQALGEEVE